MHIIARLTEYCVSGQYSVRMSAEFSDALKETLASRKEILAFLKIPIKVQVMEECGAPGPTNIWFRNYLSDRIIVTNIDRTVSGNVTLGIATDQCTALSVT